MNGSQIMMRLMKIREEKRLSVYALGKQSGVPDSTIRNHIRRHNAPSLDTYIKLCHGLDLDPAELLREGIPYELSPEEEKLIKLFRKIPLPEQRDIVIETALSVARASRKGH